MLKLIYGLICVLSILTMTWYLWSYTGISPLREVGAATALLLITAAPALLSTFHARHQRARAAATTSVIWCFILVLSVPTVLSLPGLHPPELAPPAQPEATELSPAPPLEARRVNDETHPEPPSPAPSIALPYEGDGNRLMVEVVLDHRGKQHELVFLLDTGATYTTLPKRLFDQLGIPLSDDSPTLTLHTANGDRSAQLGLVDQLWLGDFAISNTAIATCDPCESEDVVGLLGLNVAGRFNTTIDADRREVIFSSRREATRNLDMQPFTEVSATLTEYDAYTTVTAQLQNQSPHAIHDAEIRVGCEDRFWLIRMPSASAGEEVEATKRLPEHERCERYGVRLHRARW